MSAARTRHRRAAPTSRSVAYDAMRRIDHDGAFANLALPPMLARTGLDPQARAFTTELVYGTTRMRRACDVAIDRFVLREPEPSVRTLLRLGAYQLLFTAVPAHAAVSETVRLAPNAARGFVNAVLRRVAATPIEWPSIGARLSYPDWIVERLAVELGDEAMPALERMNVAPPVTTRADGYVQDRASQWVADAVEARAGDLVLDACAGPGGKATALASGGADVIAGDARVHRAHRVAHNAARLGRSIPVVAADGGAPPWRPGTFDRVLIDAPCSGLGALRRRPDARWRITASDVAELTRVQARLLAQLAPLVRPGGTLVYSVCTLTAAESIDHAVPDGFEIDARALPAPWRSYGSGHRLLPQDADTDGMVVLRYRRAHV